MYQATIDYRGQHLDGIIPILSLFFRFSVGFSWPSRTKYFQCRSCAGEDVQCLASRREL